VKYDTPTDSPGSPTTTVKKNQPEIEKRTSSPLRMTMAEDDKPSLKKEPFIMVVADSEKIEI